MMIKGRLGAQSNSLYRYNEVQNKIKEWVVEFEKIAPSSVTLVTMNIHYSPAEPWNSIGVINLNHPSAISVKKKIKFRNNPC